MLRRVGVLAIIAGIFVLTGCAFDPQTSQSNSVVVPSAKYLGVPSVSPAKDCGGVHRVTVTPCPIRLTKRTKSGIVVTVSGPGVVNSVLGTIQSCFSGQNCYNAERYSSSKTQWLITSGAYCGGADLEFDGQNARGHRVGYFFLGIDNKYCP